MSASHHIPRLESLTGHRSRAHWLAALTRRFGQGLAARAQRQALVALDPHLLDDIGITRAQAVEEAARPLWDVPPRWRR